MAGEWGVRPTAPILPHTGRVWAGVATKWLNLVSGAGPRNLLWINLLSGRESRRLVYWESDPGSWQGLWHRGSGSLQESRLLLHSQKTNLLLSLGFGTLGEIMGGTGLKEGEKKLSLSWC